MRPARRCCVTGRWARLDRCPSGRELAERIDTDGSADLLTTLAAPLPIEVIAEMLGIPAADRSLLRPWSNKLVKMYELDLDPSRQRGPEFVIRGLNHLPITAQLRYVSLVLEV